MSCRAKVMVCRRAKQGYQPPSTSPPRYRITAAIVITSHLQFSPQHMNKRKCIILSPCINKSSKLQTSRIIPSIYLGTSLLKPGRRKKKTDMTYKKIVRIVIKIHILSSPTFHLPQPKRCTPIQFTHPASQLAQNTNPLVQIQTRG